MKRLGVTMAATVPLLICMSGGAPADEPGLTPIEELGKFFFYDTRLSTPRGKQGCVSCHEPKVGWVLPLSEVNETTVGAPGAQPGAVGGRKTPSNAYASFSPKFQEDVAVIPTLLKGGNFWDGRAEGCGKEDNIPGCQLGTGPTSETIMPDDLPVNSPHVQHLGPTADQALNPTARPGVEQNTREKTVCQLVKTGPYKDLYEQVWGEPIDCKQQGDPPPYHTSFKRLAVAVAAWQASDDVNSFSSPRDDCKGANGKLEFPCDNLSAEANLGHDLFYGRNDTGENRLACPPFGPPCVDDPADPNYTPQFLRPKNAACAFCHNGVPEGEPRDGAGIALHQLYTDNAYHCLGVPYNSEIPNNTPGEDRGLGAHVENADLDGCYKTPTLRNTGKGDDLIIKAYMHNGYLKNLKDVVHFYNTASIKADCSDLNLPNATAEKAIAKNCWPQGEHARQVPPQLVGDLGLTSEEEYALVEYMMSLTDTHTPTVPDMSRNSNNKKKNDNKK